MKNRSILVALMALMACLSNSCQFGDDAETMLTKYDHVARNISFSFKATNNGGSSESVSRATLIDGGLDKGVVSNWSGDDQIALFDFGAVFTEDEEAKEIISPEAVCLKYSSSFNFEEFSGNSNNPTDGSVDWAEFKGETRAVMTEDPRDEDYEFALAYPYNAFKEEKTNVGSLTLDFDQQDGSLITMAKKVLYAWGYAKGKPEEGIVELKNKMSGCSNGPDNKWHQHGRSEEEILLDNKEAIVRFHMMYTPIQDDYDKHRINNQSLVGKPMLLDEYLALQNLVITEIMVENNKYESGVDVDGNPTYTEVPNIKSATLSLKDGSVSEGAGNAITLASPYVIHVPETITDENKAYTIDSKGETVTSAVTPLTSGSKTVWGTAFYLAVPCPISKKLDFHPFITVRTKKKDGNANGQTFFGTINHKELKEGDYYITGQVPMSTDAKQLNGYVDIFLYYNSSFIWEENL